MYKLYLAKGGEIMKYKKPIIIEIKPFAEGEPEGCQPCRGKN